MTQGRCHGMMETGWSDGAQAKEHQGLLPTLDAKKGQEESPQSLRGIIALQTHWAFSLCSCEGIHFCAFKSSSL